MLALTVLPTAAQDMKAFEKNLTIHKLDNGLTFLIYERDVAPVFSFYTHVNVGSAQEVPGITGLAHMFEHMAFKGTSRIGTNDFIAEKKALAKVDSAYAAFASERDLVGGADADRLEALNTMLKEAQEEADQFIVKNEFGEIVDRNGGVGLNASTSADQTDYFYSLPANKLELWAYLESERFLDPVFREFYKERDVVMEERRMRTESQPIGRLVEQLLSVSFLAHPYKQPTVGYMSDLQRITREDAQVFYDKYYVPGNMTISLVGAVKAKDAIPLINKYFSRIPAGPMPGELRTIEPASIGEKTVVLMDDSQPIYIEAYKRPSQYDPDDAVFNAMSDILSNGRTSRLYKSLVDDKKIAAFAGAFNGFPGSKYTNLMLFFAVSTPGSDNAELQAAIRAEIERLKTEPVAAEELKRVKTQARASLIRGLSSNQGIAIQLATAHRYYGNWKEIFEQVDRIEKVTAEDVMRVAKKTFQPESRSVAMIENRAAADTE
jgi:predicted Zn-dependent peptidase